MPAPGSGRSPGCWLARPFRGTIALTHLHWDHVQGLPFFPAADRDDARVRLLLPAPADRNGRGRAGARHVAAELPDHPA